jgi:antitoxin component YwqK of YwqJK toxin-antitoxin module
MIGVNFLFEVNILQTKTIFLLFLILFYCSSLMQKDKKTEFSLETPNLRVEKFPETFNLKGKGIVITRCAANNCSAEEIAKMDPGAIKSFVKDGKWEEYIEIVDKEDPKKKYSVLWMSGTYKDGKKEGGWEEFEEKYDPSTKIKKLVKKQFGEFKDNKKEGVWTLLTESGEKLKETPYVAGKKHGAEKKFNIKGIQIEEINYIQGERHGEYWKKNSSQLAECTGTYTKEQKTGKWTEYNTIEKKPDRYKAIISYTNDKRDGAAVIYQADGITKAAEGNYKENYKVGFWKQYYPSGALESEGNRKAEPGVIESEEKEADSEIGEVKEIKEAKTMKEQSSSCPSPNVNGKSINIGEWKKYYQSGDLFSVGSYDEKGLPAKDWKFYYKGNKLRCKGTMANALMMKNGELYDSSGNLEGKGNMMLSMFSIDEKTDQMKDKMIPAIPFTFYKEGKKYIEILPITKASESGDRSTEGSEEVRKETTAVEYNASGAQVGSGPYMFIPTQPYGGKKHGCWTEGGKKVPYLMGRVQTGRMAEMSNCK